MKKLIIFFVILSIFIPNVSAEEINVEDWYQYNGYSNTHSFSLRFPTDWQAYTLGDDAQGFSPKDDYDKEPLVRVQEFENQTYDQVISDFSDQYGSFLQSEDFLLKTINEDIIAKRTSFLEKTSGISTEIILIKRASLIVAITKNSIEFEDMETAIINSFKFTDNWYQYLDLNDNYSFIFPSKFSLSTLSDGVKLVDADKNNVFVARKYGNATIHSAKKMAADSGDDYLSSEAINFHGIDNVLEAFYENSGKKFSRIIIEKNGNSYSLSNFDFEDVPEILESFEFFEIESKADYSPYKNFSDVRDIHPNATAINSLVSQKVINGYADGTFKPDGEINRAELTKMIVTTKINPDKTIFKNCFPDVKEQWYAPYICYAKAKGWVKGYTDGNFGPEKNINRVEALKIIFGVMFAGKLTDSEKLDDVSVKDVDQKAWYAKYFIYADNNNLLDKQHIKEKNGGYYYYPESDISRKEVAETIYRAKLLK